MAVHRLPQPGGRRSAKGATDARARRRYAGSARMCRTDPRVDRRATRLGGADPRAGRPPAGQPAGSDPAEISGGPQLPRNQPGDGSHDLTRRRLNSYGVEIDQKPAGTGRQWTVASGQLRVVSFLAYSFTRATRPGEPPGLSRRYPPAGA